MKIGKKLLSALFATLFLISAATINAYAAPISNDPNGGDIGIVKPIERIDITLRTDIAGKTSWDYKDIFTIETEHVKYHNNGYYSKYPSLGVSDKDGYISDYDKKLVAGEAYQFDFYLIADTLYKFADNCKIYVNGESPENYSYYFGWDDQIGNIKQQYINISDKDWFTVTPQPGACKYCGEIHTGFFGGLIGFFHSILALFGLHK